MRRILLAGLITATSAGMLSSCVGPPASSVAPPRLPAPLPTTSPPPSLPVRADDRTVTPGSWRYSASDRLPVAEFGTGASPPVFAIGCDVAARRILLMRPGVNAGGMTITATTASRTVSTRLLPEWPGWIGAQFDPRDPLLDALAFSRGHFSISSDRARLFLPAWPEFARVLEDCRL